MMAFNVLSSIIGGTAILVAGVIWRYFRLTRPERWFWKLASNNTVTITASLHRYSDTRRSFYIPTGDTLAATEIVSLLKHVHRGIAVKFHSNPIEPLTDWDSAGTVIIIGGGKDNMTERHLLAALDPPLYERYHEDSDEDPHHDCKGLQCIDKNDKMTEVFKSSENRDFGYIIRTLDPLNRTNHVYVVVGGHTHGTYAAARWITQPKNLRWLMRKYATKNIWNYLRGKPTFDSIEVALSVNVALQSDSIDGGDESVTVLPLAGEPQLWCHEVRREATEQGRGIYYFNTPENYNDSYNNTLRAGGRIAGR